MVFNVLEYAQREANSPVSYQLSFQKREREMRNHPILKHQKRIYMKLKLKAAVLAAIIGAGMAGNASATTIGGGRIYDVGKGSYSKEEAAQANDSLLCWAAAGSNIIQYWQDAYGDLVKAGTPNGYADNSYGQPDGTRYLAVYEDFLKHNVNNGTGFHTQAIDWWFRNTRQGQLTAKENYYAGSGDVLPAAVQRTLADNGSVSDFQAMLDTGFAGAGQAVGLNIWQEHTGDFWHNSRYHAITCWGYETGADGRMTALYLTDSDDYEYGAFRVEVKSGYAWNPETGELDEDMPGIILETDEPLDGYGSRFVVSVREVTTLSMPHQAVKPAAVESAPLAAGAVVEGNIKLSGTNTVEGSGVRFGNGRDAMIAAGESGAGLVLSGGFGDDVDVEVGLTVEKGAMLSLDNLDVSFYFDGGMDVNGKAYLHNGDVFVYGNFAVVSDGAGIYNSGYMEIKDCGEVLVAANQALYMANGGGICNEGTMSIRGNDSVNFLENSTFLGEGDDIYNAKGAVLNIADNNSVYFMSGSGSVAIANRGEAYLAAGKEQSFYIVGASVDSREGTLYIGADSAGRSMDGAVSFISSDFGTSTDVAARQPGKAAVFTDVVLDACGVTGGAAGSVAHADISASSTFTFQNVAVQDVCVTLESGNVVLDGVQLLAAGSSFSSADGRVVLTGGTDINLAGVSYELAGGCATYDLTSVFGSGVAEGGSFTLSGFAKADSYLVTCGDTTLFAALCQDLLAANPQAVLEGPLVVDALKTPELAVAMESLEASVTLGGVDEAMQGSAQLTQMLGNGAAGTVQATLPEGAVTTLPDTLEMTADDMAAMADAAHEKQAGNAWGRFNRESLVGPGQWNDRVRQIFAAGTGGLMVAGAADTKNVPEPATGMLSLLALAGLAARRRRE